MLTDELHFGRVAERLGVTQGRGPQMIKRLESRVGGLLFERTSRRVVVTPLGTILASEVVPAMSRLRAGFEDAQAAASSSARPLRIGFQCAVYESLIRTVASLPAGMTKLIELPWADPFTRLAQDGVDVAVVLSPSREHGFQQLAEFSRQPQYLALSRRHPSAASSQLDAAVLSRIGMVAPAASAPDYWREANAPSTTPSGHRLRYEATASTLPEALSMVASDNLGVLLCKASAAYMPRPDVQYVPVPALPSTSLVALAGRGRTHPLVGRFAQELRAQTHAA